MTIRSGFNPRDLRDAGWGVIFPKQADPSLSKAVRLSLDSLIEWRQKQSGERYRDLEYFPDETADAFLARHGVRPGFINPEQFPYYLLIVAPPEEIPFEFQVGLGVTYAVGRVWFDILQDFSNYAHGLVEYEQKEAPFTPRAVFFAPANPGDWVSQVIGANSIQPLAERISRDSYGWGVKMIFGPDATKSHLMELLNREPPCLLTAFGKGLEFPADHPEQSSRQGALVCQEWPGPSVWSDPIPPTFTFQAEDVPEGVDLRGLISVLLYDYSLGTPQFSDAQRMIMEQPPELAFKPLITRLPQRLLAGSRNGEPSSALASVGLIDRLWSASLPDLGPAIPTSLASALQDCLRQLMQGSPLGYALDPFRQISGELSSELTSLREEVQFGKQVDPKTLVTVWAAMSTARNLAILGDPAVRIKTALAF